MYSERSYFNHQFLKFRLHYYLHEAHGLIARHKLLTAFLICLLAPGVKNIQAMGIPFYSLVNPVLSFKVKVFYLLLLLGFLLAIITAQRSFIKGGEFREYLNTLAIPLHVYKIIDFILLLFSLNIVWLAIVFGAVLIVHNSDDNLFVLSQSFLYMATVFAICTVLFNFLYQKIAGAVVVFCALLLVVSIPKPSYTLNLDIGLSVFLLCGFVVRKIKPYHPKKKHPFNLPYFKGGTGLKRARPLNSAFIIQLAVLRKNKISFFIRFILCFALSLLILYVFNSEETGDNRQGLILVLLGLQTYILSTLFTFFEKEKLDHALFYNIFPYERQVQFVKEIVLIWAGLLLAFMPVFLFNIFNLKNYCLLSLFILVMNALVLAINRIFYALSLRFCLFSSLLNTVGAWVVQYIFLEA